MDPTTIPALPVALAALAGLTISLAAVTLCLSTRLARAEKRITEFLARSQPDPDAVGVECADFH